MQTNGLKGFQEISIFQIQFLNQPSPFRFKGIINIGPVKRERHVDLGFDIASFNVRSVSELLSKCSRDTERLQR